MIYPRRVLHLTVNSKGEISSWDDRERALSGKSSDEEYVQILLSLAQTEQVKQAQKKAKTRR